ncbi:tyrosinase family protein [Niveispirillum sp. KHB5.9]|uniref:tyrosinase family protein n=1 Tax=Niveispirillum sp. KHB5.9 TaxID=3400269 RepID=UPI003A8C022D
MRVTRRDLLAGGAALAGLGVVATGDMAAAKTTRLPRYVRHDVASPEGQRMLQGYAKAVATMLEKPATDPHNWFRNAFVHYMDCPHGNWWFFVWHRGYLGYVEQTIRKYSGMDDFAFPYWDWSHQPFLPPGMFNGVLTPVADAYAKYARDLDTFTAFIKPTMQSYFNGLNASQKVQQNLRGNTDFGKLWDGVAGTNGVDIGDRAFAETARARYCTAAKPDLSPAIKGYCSPAEIAKDLAPVLFNADNENTSFTSSKTDSHNAMPRQGVTFFSLLERWPHNNVHNFIGGVGNWPGDGPFGNMTNNLSPVDPIFFLHHANMDRLWWLWEDKQRAQGGETLPKDPKTLAEFKNDQFLFFWTAEGKPVLNATAGDFIDPARFDYRYGSPVGTELTTQVAALAQEKPAPRKRLLATAPNNAAVESLSDWSIGLAAGPLQAVITFTRPMTGAVRSYSVLLNAPDDVKTAGPDNPYFTGSIDFFGGPMAGMPHQYRFSVTLKPELVAKAGGHLDLRLVPGPSWPNAPAPAIEDLQIRGG